MTDKNSDAEPTGDQLAMDAPSAAEDAPASPSLAILLIDDNPAVCRAIEIAFRLIAHRIDTAAGPEQAFSYLARRRYDAILLDMNFSPGQSDGEEGLACLARIMTDDPSARVVVITAHSGIRIAVAAMQAGARDFVMKPWRNAELVAKVKTAAARSSTRIVAAQSTAAPMIDGSPRLLGDSAAIRRVRDLVCRIAPTSASIAVTGPSGAGRTLTAMAIHAASRDAATPAARIDLRDDSAWALLEDLSGTVILHYPDRLDEVAQTRLLDRLRPDTRYIAITDSVTSLSAALRRRIATVEVRVPPLAERGQDAVLLARHFADVAAERFARPPARLTNAAEAAIVATIWPDEVRGLALAIERAVLLANDGIIDAAALAPPLPRPIAVAPAPDDFDLSNAEKAVIEAALREHRYNVTHAASALGLSRGALYRRMARYGF